MSMTGLDISCVEVIAATDDPKLKIDSKKGNVLDAVTTLQILILPS